MAHVILAANYAPGTAADGAAVETDLTAIVTELNGGLDSTNLENSAVTTAKINNAAVDSNKLGTAAVRNTHVDYTSANSGALVDRAGPNYAGANGRRRARISKTFTRSGSDETITVTFATDCVDGNPAFTAAPTLDGMPVLVYNSTTPGELPTQMWVLAITSTQCTVRCEYAGAPTADAAIMQFSVTGTV